MPFTIRVAHHNTSFIAHEDETILEAALRQNFDIPHSCCEGICGSCEGQVIDGFVKYDATEHLIIDDHERAAGKALFCSAKACSDLLINVHGVALPHSHTTTLARYELLELNLLSQNVYQAYFQAMDKPLHYLAGQYVEIHWPHQEPKPFSIANSPHKNGLLELHIRCQPDNEYAQQLIHWLQQEKIITVKGPYGRCFYHPEPRMPMIALAVGTGFAPIKAILEQALVSKIEHEITLFWAGKLAHDLYQISLPKAWENQFPHFRFVPILLSAKQHENWPGVYGNVLDVVLDYYPRLDQHHIYFGGPMQLTMDALEKFSLHGAQTCYMYSDVFDLA